MKTKTPRVKSGDGGASKHKDPLTGYWMEVNGQKLLTDTIYGQESRNGQGPITEFQQYEFEFGKKAVVLTFTGGSENWKRYTLIGEFNYDKNGKMTTAKTREFADWTHSPSSEWKLVFQRQPTSTSPYEIFSGFGGNNAFDYDRQREEDPSIATGVSPDDFNNFEAADYYNPRPQWWANPFNSNLV